MRRPRVQPLAAPITEYPAKISSPKDVSGLILWHRADLGISRTGTVVDRWEDQSGTGDANKHLERSSGSPEFIPGDPDFNQKPTVRFTGNAAMLHAANWASVPSQPFTVFLVGDSHPRADGGAAGYFMYPFGTPDVDFTFYSAWNASMGIPTLYMTNYLQVTSPQTDASTRYPHVYCITVNGASSTIHVDGFQNALAGPNNPGAGVIRRVQLSSSSGNVPINGRVAEIAVYSGALSEANRGSVMRYLRERYMTPVASEGTSAYTLGVSAGALAAEDGSELLDETGDFLTIE